MHASASDNHISSLLGSGGLSGQSCPAECIPILTPTNIVLDLVRATPVHHNCITGSARTHMNQQVEVIRAA